MCSRTDRQTGNPIFYKVETYLDRLLVFEIQIKPNFVKIFLNIVTAVLEIYEVVFTDRQTDSMIFYKVETYLDRLLVLAMHKILNFVKID